MPNWAGGWDHVFSQPYALLNEPDATLRGIARLMAPQAQKGRGEIAVELTGSAVGAAASASVAQVAPRQADGMNLGGLVPIVQTVAVGRPTEAADAAILDAQFQPTFAPTTYPVDKSGNGGGGMLGTVNK